MKSAESLGLHQRRTSDTTVRIEDLLEICDSSDRDHKLGNKKRKIWNTFCVDNVRIALIHWMKKLKVVAIIYSSLQQLKKNRF